MTPRCFWDRDGYLYEVNPEDRGRLRIVWGPENGWKTSMANDGSGSFGDMEDVERAYGPLVAVA